MGLIKFLDKLEDKIRFSLSRRPLLYAFVSGVGIVLFFRGVWLVADMFDFLTGIVTLIIALVILLITGAFVSHFISEKVVVSGLKKEKRFSEKSSEEIIKETEMLKEIKEELARLRHEVEKLKQLK